MRVKDLIRQLTALSPELPVVIDFAWVDEVADADANGFADVTAAYDCEAERPGGDVWVVKLSIDPEHDTPHDFREKKDD